MYAVLLTTFTKLSAFKLNNLRANQCRTIGLVRHSDQQESQTDTVMSAL